MSLAGSQHLDSALPHTIDLLQSTVGSMSSSRGGIVDGSDSESSSSDSNSSSTNNSSTSGSGDLAEPGSALGSSGLGNNTSLLGDDDLLLLLLLDLNINLNGNINIDLNLLVNDHILLDMLEDSLTLGGGGGSGSGLILGDDLLLASDDGNGFGLLNNLLDFLNGLEGLIGLDLVGEALCLREGRNH